MDWYYQVLRLKVTIFDNEISISCTYKVQTMVYYVLELTLL